MGEAASTPDGIATTIIRPRRGLAGLGVADCWRYRDLLLLLTWRDLAVRYKQTFLGVAWVLLQPAATVAVFSLFLGRLAKLPSDGLPYPLFVLCAIVPWLLVSRAMSDAALSLAGNERLISKVFFPRLLLPTAAVGAATVDLLITTVLVVGVVLIWGPAPSLALLALPLFLLQSIVLALAVSWCLAGLDALFRDVRYTLPFLVQLWFFASPIAYSAGLVREDLRWVYGLNPMTGLCEGFRWALLGAAMPSPGLLAASALVTVVGALGGLVLFRAAERDLADRL
jgi:lipopolysaccharide transport system permease protein